MITPARGRVGLLAIAMMVVIVLVLWADAVLLVFRSGPGPLNNAANGLCDGTLAAAAVLCALRAASVERERVAWALMAAAIGAWSAGEIYYDLFLSTRAVQPIPSVADGFWLAFYPLVIGAVVMLGRSRLRNVSWRAWLDAGSAALGVASVAAAVIFGTSLPSTHGQLGVAGVVDPVGDLVLIALVIVVALVCGRRALTRDWPLMILGFALFTVTDSVHLTHTLASTYILDTPLDIGWPLGLVLVSLAAWFPFRRAPGRGRSQAGVAAPVTLSMLGFGVLVVDHFHRTNGLAISLAALCAATVAVRLALSFGDRQAAEASATARDEALEAADAKSLFVATVSHELRTPLNGVIGMTELLLGTELTGVQREYADIARASAEGLLLIVNDILDYSKFAAGKVNLVMMDFALSETIAEACAMLLVAARSKGIEIDVASDPELEPWLHGDANRIRQVVINLVSNAVKFTDHGSVTVSVSGSPIPLGTLVRVEVADTGIGIEETALARLFEPFTQAGTATERRFGGTGLGLTICAQLVEAMGGTIGARSTPGKGSTFWFELPLAGAKSEHPWSRPRDAVAAPARAVARSGESPLVLVAEDNPISQMVAVRLLEKLGYRVEVVADGHEALEAVSRAEYAAILMDCEMPVMNGYEATRAIRGREVRDARMPIIAMTAHSGDGAEAKCRAAGMDDYVTKPVRQQALRDALVRAIPAAPELSTPAQAKDDDEPLGGEHRRLAALRSLPQDELRDLLALSFDHVASLVVLLVRAVQLDDASTAATISHSLKGASLSIGAEGVSRIAAELEASARAGDLRRAGEMIAALQRAMAQDRAGSGISDDPSLMRIS